MALRVWGLRVQAKLQLVRRFPPEASVSVECFVGFTSVLWGLECQESRAILLRRSMVSGQ